MQSALVISLYVASFFCGVLSFAQHPGAYSSPHYAKKNSYYSHSYNQPTVHKESEYEKLPTVEHKVNAERSKHQEIDLIEDVQGRPSNPAQNFDGNDLEIYNDTQTGRSSGFMESAGNFLRGRGGQMLVDITRELIARSTGTSQVGGECIAQVLSLNLTNLVILVVLKALILAAGLFGAGFLSHTHGRSLEEDNSIWIKEDELSLWMGYLEGGDFGCLSKAACEAPNLSKKYSSGADILLTGAKLLSGTVPYDERYEKVVDIVKEAADYGSSGANCDAKYRCTKNDKQN